MRKRKLFLNMIQFIMLTAFLVSCTSSAQEPNISTKYSDNEISELLINYNNSNNKDVKVDGIILQNFKKDFPGARDVEWETNDELYEVEFDIKNKDFEAFYDANGELLLYKQDVQSQDLPSVVKNTAKEKYSGYHFDDIDKIVKGTQTFYKIEMEKRDHDVTIYINIDGTIIDRKPNY